MTEAERRSFCAYAASRGPNKRKIVPKKDFFNKESNIANVNDDDDEDEDDCDFVADDTTELDEETDSSESIESTNNEAEDNIEQDEPDKKKFSCLASSSAICSICLNLLKTVRDEEMVQCDKCGIYVHELCYSADGDDCNSNSSSSSTEPWFCEPCLYGLTEPPYCELCPNRFGAFKRADLGGGWVHLLCALYTPGITFGEINRLSGISWQEIDYKLFGKRPCAACVDQNFARTGITVGCDAALCKNYLHVTCAQRLGLLVNNSDNLVSSITEGKVLRNGLRSAADVEAIDLHYLTCKKHCFEELAVRQKKAYAAFHEQEELRMKTLKRRMLNAREEQKRLRMFEKHKKLFKRLEGVTIVSPEADSQKRPRSLHSSMQVFDMLADKAELRGECKQDFFNYFYDIDGAQLPYIPPGFSVEFVRYFDARETKLIPDEMKKLENIQLEVKALREQQSKLENQYNTLLRSNGRTDAEIIREWQGIFRALGVKKVKSVGKRKSRTKSCNAKNSVKSSSRESHKAENFALKDRRAIHDNIRANESSVSFHTCSTCGGAKNQHSLIRCDSCTKFYHLNCLSPPLKRMPKMNRMWIWQCSSCSESIDQEVNESNESQEVASSSPKRRLRDRSAMYFIRKEEEKAQARAYRAALRKVRVTWKGRKKVSESLPALSIVESKAKNRRLTSVSSVQQLPNNVPVNDALVNGEAICD